MLARVKMESFDPILSSFKGAGYDSVFYRLVFRDLEPAHHIFKHVACKDSHQIIFKGDEKLRLARVPLPAASSSKLIVDAARFMSFSAENKQTTKTFYLLCHIFYKWHAAKLDIHS